MGRRGPYIHEKSKSRICEPYVALIIAINNASSSINGGVLFAVIVHGGRRGGRKLPPRSGPGPVPVRNERVPSLEVNVTECDEREAATTPVS